MRAQASARNWSLLRAAIAMIAPCGFTPGASGTQRRVADPKVVEPPHPPEAVGAGTRTVLAHAHARREMDGHQVGAVPRHARPTTATSSRDPRTTGPSATDGYSSVAPAARSTSPRCTSAARQTAHVAFRQPGTSRAAPAARAAPRPARGLHCESRRSRRRRAPSRRSRRGSRQTSLRAPYAT